MLSCANIQFQRTNDVLFFSLRFTVKIFLGGGNVVEERGGNYSLKPHLASSSNFGKKELFKGQQFPDHSFPSTSKRFIILSTFNKEVNIKN